MTDLNRSFPGNPDGTLTQQLAHALHNLLVPRCPTILDFHSGGNLATVSYCYRFDDGGLAEAFGCEVLYGASSYQGSLSHAARAAGAKVAVLELGGGQQRNAHFLEVGLRGIENVMKLLGMLDGEPQPPAWQIVVDEMRIMRPHRGGLMLSTFGPDRLGEQVARGTQLARIVSPYTFEVLEELVAPFDPTVLVLGRDEVTKVEVGDYGFMVANGATARIVR
jgi:predicted deacylase